MVNLKRSNTYEIFQWRISSTGCCKEWDCKYSKGILTSLVKCYNKRNTISFWQLTSQMKPENITRHQLLGLPSQTCAPPDKGFEPLTVGLKVKRFTDWANRTQTRESETSLFSWFRRCPWKVIQLHQTNWKTSDIKIIRHELADWRKCDFKQMLWKPREAQG